MTHKTVFFLIYFFDVKIRMIDLGEVLYTIRKSMTAGEQLEKTEHYQYLSGIINTIKYLDDLCCPSGRRTAIDGV